MKRRFRKLFWVLMLVAELASAASVTAQEPPEDSGFEKREARKERASTVSKKHAKQFLWDFLDDEKEVWTSPKLRFGDSAWLLPIGGFTAGLLLTDSNLTRHLSHNPKTLSHYTTLSNAGLATLIGGAGGMWMLSHYNHNEHWQETGFLAGEAAVHSLLMTEALKYSLRRERPYQGNGTGSFFQSGGTSFPSEHSAIAWSAAGVIAHEYPGPLTKILAYGAASLVSYSRVRAQKHFPSDVFVGELIGNLIAQDIYSRHANPELGGAEWGSLRALLTDHSELSPHSMGSPHVPLDSWVYPTFERLEALGYLNTAFEGLKPWTRTECARLYEEAHDAIEKSSPDNSTSQREQASNLLDALGKEFRRETSLETGDTNNAAQLESVYIRVMRASGTGLNDSYHFGQTIINDYGRPYQEGLNTYDGLSGYLTSGRFTIYVRGEYQHAPSAPALTLAARQVIANVDNNPLLPPTPVSETNQFRLLDTYVAASLVNWDLAFGKQSLWWGPAQGGALLFSDNAEPIYMFRASRIAPFKLPWIFRWLGPMKWDLFVGKLSGNQYPPRPMIHGEKISFKPTENLELGFARTAEFGGVGRALTLGALLNSYFSYTSSVNYSASQNPGERNGGFDFSYRLPRLRNWLSVYGDTMSRDDPSPLDAPRRAALNFGLHMPLVPLLRKLDLRVEAVNTNAPTSRSTGGQFFYHEGFYRDLYTNKNNLIGDWIGRQGQGIQAWGTYWFSPRNTLQFGYRHGQVASDFIPGGGKWHDFQVSYSVAKASGVYLKSFVQFEHIVSYPLLFPGSRNNVTATVELGILPQWGRRATSVTLPGSTQVSQPIGDSLP